MSAMSAVGTARGLALGSKESLMTVNSDNYNCLDEDGNLKQYVPPCYVWAGYLPPGKNIIYIYDRLNERILSKEVVIELCPTGESSGVPAELEFPSKPRTLAAAATEKLDQEYAEEVEQERQLEEAAKAERLRLAAAAAALTASKKGKKGKGKKKK